MENQTDINLIIATKLIEYAKAKVAQNKGDDKITVDDITKALE